MKRVIVNKEHNKSRLSSARRGYDRRWRKARSVFLKANPLCVRCRELGKTIPANVVDHVTPHRGDRVLFWDMNNWQALCENCHDSWKQSIERTNRLPGCDRRGIPVDPNHHWK